MTGVVVVPLQATGHTAGHGSTGSVVVLPQCGPPVVVHPAGQEQVIVEIAMQGPPGKNGDGSGALLIDNRLNEFAGDTAAQAQAQANLGLGVADPLAYYILAKS